jgi:hypothetical protein
MEETAMKKIIPILVIIGLVFALWACNSPGNENPGGTPGGTPGEGGPPVTGGGSDHIYKFESSNDYPGVEIKLADLNIGSLSDISTYASVTVNATLYTDEAGSTKATVPSGDKKNLAQFKLLKATGNWDNSSNVCGGTQYNMEVDGPTTWNVTSGASGTPAILLVQANWSDFTADGTKVKSMKINSVTFTPKTGGGGGGNVALDKVYDNGSYMAIAGNKITFNNAMYSDAAAMFVFPDSFPSTSNLSGKQLVIKFTVESHSSHALQSGGPIADGAEHQIHIQAANSNKNDYNGENPGSGNGNRGQLYITLDDAAATGWADNSGTFKVSLTTLLAAAGVNSSSGGGAFTLNAIRICNNGTNWDNEGVTHKRCKSYALVINSVTVE